jgi:hypothetical protein
MKKSVLFTVLLICLVINSFGQGSQPGTHDYNFALLVEMNHMVPADESYRELYGFSAFLPGVRAEVKINRSNFAWGEFSFLTETGTTKGEMNEPIEADHFFIGFGGGFRIKLSQKSNLDLRYGGVFISYKEKAFQEEVSGDTFGLELGIDYRVRVLSRVFVDLYAAYITGKSKTEESKISITLGGFKTGIGIGVGF